MIGATAVAASLLAFEGAIFGGASLLHAGVLLDGYQHGRAATAEGVIAAVLLIGSGACLVRPQAAWAIALATQACALLGTLVGAFTIAIGVGPQTTADYGLHLLMLAVLLSGLMLVRQCSASDETNQKEMRRCDS